MYRKILVGTDGSDTAAKAVERAVEVALSSGASLTILSAGSTAAATKIVDDEKARLAASGVAIDTVVKDAEPVGALVETAREGGYDLLVMGNRGMTGVSRFLRLGSVPNKVTHQIPCSLLIVKTT